jgi:uncharacterized protein (DUF2249 family)
MNMKVSSKTKISEVIIADKRSIDVMSEINSHFKKLKNPILRKLFAGHVTIADAAKIGGVDPEVILKKLEGIGFEADYRKYDVEETSENDNLSIKNQKIIELDVRQTLGKGVDPFDDIMKAISTLGSDETLKIVNTFEPIPLIRVLKEKGFDSSVERIPPDLVITYFKKAYEIGNKKPEPVRAESTEAEFDQLYDQFSGRLTEIDVRHLEMPLPMAEILSALERLPEGNALFVNHKRIPQFLLGELENRSYSLVSKVVDEANTKLIIYKK